MNFFSKKKDPDNVDVYQDIRKINDPKILQAMQDKIFLINQKNKKRTRNIATATIAWGTGLLMIPELSEIEQIKDIIGFTKGYTFLLLSVNLLSAGIAGSILSKLSETKFTKEVVFEKIIPIINKKNNLLGNSYENNSPLLESGHKTKEFIKNFLDTHNPLLEKIFTELDLSRIDDKIQKKNVELINAEQKHFLESSFPDQSFNFEDTKRILVLYCRHYQINACDFVILAKTIQKYVNEGFSKVFNDVFIVSRAPNEYHNHLLQNSIPYKNVSGDNFVRACSLGANTIHFTHGLPQENKYGSTPILSASVRGDSEKMQNVSSYVPLPLRLDYRQNIYIPKNEKLGDGDISEMVKQMIFSIQELEKKLLHLE